MADERKMKDRIMKHLNAIDKEDPKSSVNYDVRLSVEGLLDDKFMTKVLAELRDEGHIDGGYKGEETGTWIVLRKTKPTAS